VVVRLLVVICLVFALAGFQWLRPLEGMNLFFVLDRSDSIPANQQEAARKYINNISRQKKTIDKAGVIVFGTEASIESSPNAAVDLQKVQAVVGTDRTDLAAAVRALAGRNAAQTLATKGNETMRHSSIVPDSPRVHTCRQVDVLLLRAIVGDLPGVTGQHRHPRRSRAPSNYRWRQVRLHRYPYGYRYPGKRFTIL